MDEATVTEHEVQRVYLGLCRRNDNDFFHRWSNIDEHGNMSGIIIDPGKPRPAYVTPGSMTIEVHTSDNKMYISGPKAPRMAGRWHDSAQIELWQLEDRVARAEQGAESAMKTLAKFDSLGDAIEPLRRAYHSAGFGRRPNVIAAIVELITAPATKEERERWAK